jgi:hypothetical protein
MNPAKHLIACIATLCLCASEALAQGAASMVSLEVAVEASTTTALMPTSTAGVVSLTSGTSYSVTADTTYFIGKKQVTLTQLNTYVALGPHSMTLFLKSGSSVVNRIVVAAH